MARGRARQGATTHQSRHNGHGQKVAHRRFAIKSNLGQPKGKFAPWYLKSFGSRPAHKLKPAAALKEVA